MTLQKNKNLGSVNELAQEAIHTLKLSITDQVFLIIQSDKQLMQAYLKLVREKGHDVVNREVGKAVKAAFNLANDDFRNNDPESTLIQSYQIFK